ncbi:MAG TPA: histidine kinase, partial [Bacteroidota bacterium]
QRHALLVGLAGLGLFLLATMVHYLIATFDAARAAERKGLESQLLARDAELRALRAQVDPHFLFNSLNSISALTAANPPAARMMSLKLAEFLRLTMESGSANAIPLEQEVSLALRYLDIEKVRFGARLQIRSSMDDDVRACRIPPLLIQPLVENAVNHGIAHLLEGGPVSLSAARQGQLLVIAVENPVDPESPVRRGNGRGLENVRQRIWKTYGTSAQVVVRHDPASWRVELRLPLVEP